MLTLVPQLRGLHEQLVLARLDSIEHLVTEAEKITDIEIVIVVEQQLDHVAVGVLAGDEAIVHVAEVAKWATWFLAARLWVPLLIIDMDRVELVTFARTTAVEKPDHCLHRHRHRPGDLG